MNKWNFEARSNRIVFYTVNPLIGMVQYHRLFSDGWTAEMAADFVKYLNSRK